MKLRTAGRHKDVIQLQMTPMIDVVFLLLIFFLLTFKIIAPRATSISRCRWRTLAKVSRPPISDLRSRFV